MKPTRPWVLLTVFAVLGVAGGLVVATTYDSLPTFPLTWVLTVAVIALMVAFLAWTTRNRLRGEHGARPPEPLTMARYAALARAVSPVGAGVAGAWLGALVYLLTAAGAPTVVHDRGISIAGLVTGVGLSAAGLWLEWICRVKIDQDDDPDGPRGRPRGPRDGHGSRA